MKISFASTTPEASDADLLAVVIADPATAAGELAGLDQLLGGAIARELSRDRLRPGKGDSVTIPGGDSGPGRVLLVGVGSLDGGRAEALRVVGSRLASAARAARADSVALRAPSLADEGADTAADLASIVEGALLGAYRNDRYKSSNADGDEAASSTEHSLEVLGASSDAQAAAERAILIAEATNWARDLANCPANFMTPAALAAEAEQLAAQHEHLSVKALDKAQIEALDMGMLLAVAQGSVNEPRLIVLEWNPPADTCADDQRLALVGKAVTFDTGGISIKPSAGMAEMRLDKSGGCAVLGAMRAIAATNVPRRVLAVVAAAENMPGGNAYKPGDVITAADGTTIEVTNTDAEGRLVLGDAITHARSLGCAAIVEASTLTGAMVVALGHWFAGAISKDDELVGAVLASAGRTGDNAWHLPMHDAYKGSLKSDIADMVNSGGRPGGSLYAGLFLQHFAKDTPFVHLDVAGTAMLPKPQSCFTAKGASGWGVRLMTDLAATR